MAEMYYRASNPDHPWLTPCSIQILASFLKPSDVGLEFGSGRSTIWFARRVNHLTSVEHNEEWFGKVNRKLQELGQTNVAYHLRPKDYADDDASNSKYVRTLGEVARESIDFVLVDGVYRDYCALGAIPLLRPGGVLIIDNANWYLPCASIAPSSRNRQQGPMGETWAKVFEQIESWRTIWTSSGVSDTAFFFKPTSG